MSDRSIYAAGLGRRLRVQTDGDPEKLAALLGVAIEDLGPTGGMPWTYVPPSWVPFPFVALRSGAAPATKRDLTEALAYNALEHEQRPLYVCFDDGREPTDPGAQAEAEAFAEAFLGARGGGGG